MCVCVIFFIFFGGRIFCRYLHFWIIFLPSFRAFIIRRYACIRATYRLGFFWQVQYIWVDFLVKFIIIIIIFNINISCIYVWIVCHFVSSNTDHWPMWQIKICIIWITHIYIYAYPHTFHLLIIRNMYIFSLFFCYSIAMRLTKTANEIKACLVFFCTRLIEIITSRYIVYVVVHAEKAATKHHHL